ncbi:MAG: putative sulfate exporter family transporter, partial [Thermoleophilia bacterium]
FAIMLGISLLKPDSIKLGKLASSEADVFRTLFFAMTFFTIGLVSNFKRLWAEGMGKLAAVYVVSLFGFIVWIGLIVSWIFFHGVKPPLA